MEVNQTRNGLFTDILQKISENWLNGFENGKTHKAHSKKSGVSL